MDTSFAVQQFLQFVIGQLVEFPDDVIITVTEEPRRVVARVKMRQTDVGKVIGRNGQVIKAVRNLLSAAAARHNQKAYLELIEEREEPAAQ